MSRVIVVASVSVLALFGAVVGGRAIRSGEQPLLRGPFVGSYTATVTSAQAAARGDPRLTGRFTLVLRANGTYTDSNPLDGTDHGRVARLAHGQLRFYQDRYCKLGGLERPQGGIYRWSLSSSRLTLRLVNEGGCTGRTDTLTYPVWIRNQARVRRPDARGSRPARAPSSRSRRRPREPTAEARPTAPSTS